jgi:hypothetical protein
MTVRLFTGFDPREAVGFHSFVQSLIETSPGVGVTPISGPSDGSNAFTLARFRIMEICNWSGFALFLDGADMLLRDDVTKLWDLRDKDFAVQVVKHSYETKNHRKYIGTEMESENSMYPRKNWSSAMLINCGHISHFKHRHALREALEKKDGAFLHRFSWLDDDEIGELPVEWNHLVGEIPANPQAKLAHFTLGLPGFDYYAECEYADEWRSAAIKTTRGMQYDFQRPSER